MGKQYGDEIWDELKETHYADFENLMKIKHGEYWKKVNKKVANVEWHQFLRDIGKFPVIDLTPLEKDLADLESKVQEAWKEIRRLGAELKEP